MVYIMVQVDITVKLVIQLHNVMFIIYRLLLMSGNYFTGPLGTGNERAVGFPITTTQTIYFYDKSGTLLCRR
jgi:hypothetical protein